MLYDCRGAVCNNTTESVMTFSLCACVLRLPLWRLLCQWGWFIKFFVVASVVLGGFLSTELIFVIFISVASLAIDRCFASVYC